MRRREFIALVGGTVAWPVVGRAQQRLPRIAIVHPSHPINMLSATTGNRYFRTFFAELGRLGFSAGENLTVERYSGYGRTDRYAELAKEIVRRSPDLIFVVTSRMALHFKGATETIPIVCLTSDPIARGIDSSLARPGSNITGVVTDAGIEVLEKRLALLREVLPSAEAIGFLAPRGVVEGPQGRAIREASARMGVLLIMGTLESPINEGEYARVFALLGQERAQALVVGDAGENVTHLRSIVDLATKARFPSIYAYRDFTDGGGLMAYAVDLAELYYRAAGQVAQILKGARTNEIPFYQATTFKLLINLKAAKALGVTIPPTLLARADEVIE